MTKKHEEDLTRGRRRATRSDSLTASANEPQVAEPMKDGEEPYFVEVDENGCERCHQGKTWTVVGPDGVAIGQSFSDEEQADDIAALMNLAYWAGKGDTAAK